MKAKEGYRPEKKPSRHSPRLTVMIVKSMGKVRSFKISSSILLWSSLFFALYLIASVIIFNKYLDEIRLKKHLSGQLERLAHGVEDTKSALYRSQQDLVLLRDYIHKLQSSKVEDAGPAEAEEVKQGNAPPTVESDSGEKVDKKPQETLVEIKDLSVKKQGTKVTVSFALVNVHWDRMPVSGYVHIIATNKESDPPQLWAFPKVALRNGIPINYRGGQAFKIKRFKTIRGRYFLNTTSEFPSSLKVLVYSQSGNLMLEREFQVNKAS
jgi:hypothetical protein